MAKIDSISEEQQHLIFPLPPPSLITPKAQLLCDWQDNYDLLWRDARYWQSIIRPNGEPPPFYKGALSCLDRHTSSSAVQLTFDHAFTASYSDLFRPRAGNNTLCPEHTHHIMPPSPIIEQQRFDRLMRNFLDPRSHRPLPPLPHPILREHRSHNLSGLAREVSDSGLVRVAHSGGIRQTTSCSNAPPSLHPVTSSLEPVPSTHTSSAPLMVASNSAISNVPLIVFFALCPPIQTLLDW